MGAYYVNGGVGHAAAVIQALGAWPTLQRPVVSSSSSSAAVAAATVTALSAASTASAAAVSVSTPLASPRQSVDDDLQRMTTSIHRVLVNETPALNPTPICTLPSPPPGQILSTAAGTVTNTTAAATTTTATVQVSLSGSGKTIISINVIDVVDSIERMIGTTLS